MKTNKLLPLLVIGLIMTGCQRVEETETVASDTREVSQAQNKGLAADYNTRLGLGYLEKGDMSRAKRKLMRALEQAPHSAKVSGALAYFFEKSSQLKEADFYYRQALRQGHNKGAQLNNYGTFLCRQGKYQLADTYFLRASQDVSYDKTASALENAGLCASATANKVSLAKAKAYFVDALNRDPKRYKSLNALIEIASNEKAHAKVIHFAQQYASIGTLNAQSTWLAYKAAVALNKRDLADTYASTLRKRFKNTHQYQQLLVSNQYYDGEEHRFS